MTNNEATALLALCEAALKVPFDAAASGKFFARAGTTLPDAIQMLREAAEIIRNRCPGCAEGIDIIKWSPGVFVHRGGTASCKCTDAERRWLARWDGEPEEGKHG